MDILVNYVSHLTQITKMFFKKHRSGAHGLIEDTIKFECGRICLGQTARTFVAGARTDNTEVNSEH